jgi:hypothetical protein
MPHLLPQVVPLIAQPLVDYLRSPRRRSQPEERKRKQKRAVEA